MSDGRRWNIKFADSHNLNLFTDEFTYVADEIRKLPYGILALIADCLKDLKNGSEVDIDETDWPTYEKMYYFISGILLTKKEKTLSFEEDDLNRLDDIMEILITKMSLVEGHFAGILDARYIDDEWLYGMTKDRAAAFLREFQNT